MDALLNLFHEMPRWWGVVFLVVFAFSGRGFRENWKHQNQGWKGRCWLYGVLSTLSFCLLVFGSFSWTQ